MISSPVQYECGPPDVIMKECIQYTTDALFQSGPAGTHHLQYLAMQSQSLTIPLNRNVSWTVTIGALYSGVPFLITLAGWYEVQGCSYKGLYCVAHARGVSLGNSWE